MAIYETIPRPVTAMQWDGNNLADLLIFAAPHIAVHNNFLSFDQYAEFIRERDENVPLNSEAEISGIRSIPKGAFIIKCPSGKLEVMAPAQFLRTYRQAQEVKPIR